MFDVCIMKFDKVLQYQVMGTFIVVYRQTNKIGRFDLGRFDLRHFDLGHFDMGRFDSGTF